MLLLHVFHQSKRRPDQEATWAFLAGFERSTDAVVVHYPTLGAEGYWRALEAVWDHDGDVVICEQDKVPTLEHIVELVNCPADYCAWDFLLVNGKPWSEMDGGHGLGLAKFTRAARQAIRAHPPVPHIPWPDTVPYVHNRMAPVHVHRPCITHNHGLAQMSVISSESGQIEYVCWVAPTCVSGTAAASYTTTAVPVQSVYLWRAEFRIPPGHQGLTGIALVDSGTFVIPYSSPSAAWLVGDDDLLEYPYDKLLGTSVSLATYNTDDTYNHGWQVRLIYTPASAVEAPTGGVIVAPAPADWLAGPGG